MEKIDIIKGFSQLGKLMLAIGSKSEWKDFSIGVTQEEFDALNDLVVRQKHFNAWFTEENVRNAINALGLTLTEDQLTFWQKEYTYTKHPKRVGIIMAGNIPLVGFHDFLCVLLSGNTAVCKLSSDDKTLLPAFANQLIQFVPELKERIEFHTGRIGSIEAIIATGSDNSMRYFEEYFGKYPHIFRSGRTSLAVLNGDESQEELEQLGHDIFDYFGLGCRNVSHLLLPEGFLLDRIFEGIFQYGSVINHHKYANNYEYNRAVFMLNLVPVFDNNFVILREHPDLFSPLGVVHYQYYKNQEERSALLEKLADKIQAIVGKYFIPFGKAQCPMLNEYADGVDTMVFLNSLN